MELERDLLDDRDGALDALLDGLRCVGGVRSSSGPSWRARGEEDAFGIGRNGELSNHDESADLGKARGVRLSRSDLCGSSTPCMSTSVIGGVPMLYSITRGIWACLGVGGGPAGVKKDKDKDKGKMELNV